MPGGGWKENRLVSSMAGKARAEWRLAAAFLGVVLALGGCATTQQHLQPDLDAVRQDLNALRRDIAGLTKGNVDARVFTDERLARLERDQKDLRWRLESTLKESEGLRATLISLDKDLRALVETSVKDSEAIRKESAVVFRNLNTRLDELDQLVRTLTRRAPPAGIPAEQTPQPPGVRQ